MNTEILFQIAAVGIIVTVLDQLLRKAERPDIASLVSVAGLIGVLFLIIGQLTELLDTLRTSFGL